MARRFRDAFVWGTQCYLRSRFVSQKFIAYIAQFNKKDMIDPGRSHAVRKGDAGYRQDLQIE